MRLCLTVGASLLLLSANVGSAAAEGLFDLLMGTPPPPAGEAPQANTLTVHRRHVRPRPSVPRVSRTVKPDPVHKAVIAIDPVKVTDWYLRDPTLRRGDIIVLKSGVLVYAGHRGRAARRAADFARLRDARFLPARLRDFVARATAANGTSASDVAPPKPKLRPSAS